MTQMREQPQPPFPAQHQEKPGIESELTPRPEYQAPHYKGSSKLEGKVALITGGDSGIGRAVAVLYAREGADVAIVYLPVEQSDAEETKRAVGAEGRRANCGSITGLQGSRELLDYSATKGAIHAFTKSLAQNLVDKGIRVNCVAPGPVWTPLNPSDRPAEAVAKFGEQTPLKRPAQPEEIAPAFVFFASDADSSYITGEVLTLTGGQTTAA